VAVFLSRFHEKKGIELLLDACAGMADGFDLVLAGMGETGYVESLKARIAGLGLSERVHWAGFVQGDDKWRLLQGADVFVLPSYSENFGIVVLEAMACGLPVVVSDQVALCREVSRCGAGLVVGLGAEEVRGALYELLVGAPEKAVAMGQAGRALVEREFSWEAMAGGLIAAYEESVSLKP
jgi:glycosyltransferase involved in cell wall biosynthesis